MWALFLFKVYVENLLVIIYQVSALLQIYIIAFHVIVMDDGFIQEDGVNITANSLHPGIIRTNLFRHNSIVNGNYLLLHSLVKMYSRSDPFTKIVTGTY